MWCKTMNVKDTIKRFESEKEKKKNQRIVKYSVFIMLLSIFIAGTILLYTLSKILINLLWWYNESNGKVI